MNLYLSIIFAVVLLLLLVFYLKKYITLAAGLFLIGWFLLMLLRSQPIMLLILLVFFVVATLAKAINKMIRKPPAEKDSKQRDLIDFLPICLSILIGVVIAPKGSSLVYTLFFSVISFGLSDILGSEFGPIFSKQAFEISRFRSVPHGTPGAISLAGIVFSVVGAVLGGIPGVFFGISFLKSMLIMVTGFVVAQIDTVLNTWLKTKKVWRKNELINFISCILCLIGGFICFYK